MYSIVQGHSCIFVNRSKCSRIAIDVCALIYFMLVKITVCNILYLYVYADLEFFNITFVVLTHIQWVIVEQAVNCYSRILVPLYDTLGPDAVSYVINKSMSYYSVAICHIIVIVFCGLEKEKFPLSLYIPLAACMSVVACHSTKVSLLFSQAQKAPSLKTVIKLDGEITAEEREKSKDTGIAIYSMEEVEVGTFYILTMCLGHSFCMG